MRVFIAAFGLARLVERVPFVLGGRDVGLPVTAPAADVDAGGAVEEAGWKGSSKGEESG